MSQILCLLLHHFMYIYVSIFNTATYGYWLLYSSLFHCSLFIVKCSLLCSLLYVYATFVSSSHSQNCVTLKKSRSKLTISFFYWCDPYFWMSFCKEIWTAINPKSLEIFLYHSKSCSISLVLSFATFFSNDETQVMLLHKCN